MSEIPRELFDEWRAISDAANMFFDRSELAWNYYLVARTDTALATFKKLASVHTGLAMRMREIEDKYREAWQQL